MKWESYSRYQGGVGEVGARLAIYIRTKMFNDTMALAKVTASTRTLDVGATSEDRPGTNFVEELYPYKDKLTATGIEDASWLEQKYPGVKFVHADAGKLPFEDGAFDLVIASAMIEHVGSRDNQRAVVRELLRVGKKVCLTTPNRYFPVEFHTVMPLIHWLPPPVFRSVLRKVGREYFASEETLNLLSARQLQKLVPAGRKVTLKRYRLLGWTSNLLVFIE